MPIATPPLFESTIKSLPLLGRGKVRDIYAVGDDKLLIITTDRLSAFDATGVRWTSVDAANNAGR